MSALRLLLVIVLGVGMTAAAATAAEGGSEVQNVTDEKDAPEVLEGQPFVGKLILKNTNDRAIRVDHVDATCTCATIEVAEHFLLPGASTAVSYTMDTKNLSGMQRHELRLYASDESADTPTAVFFFRVKPLIAVDVLRADNKPDARPQRDLQDIYQLRSIERPDELHRLDKTMRLWSPPDLRPAEGLKVTKLEYSGTLWTWSSETQADGSVLVHGKASDPKATVAQKLYNETLHIFTNQPGKPDILIGVLTNISLESGREGAVDPFANIPTSQDLPPVMPSPH